MISRRWNRCAASVAGAAIAAALLCAGCRQSQSRPPSVGMAPPAPQAQPEQHQASRTPIRDSLVQLLADDAAGQESLFPKGTRLNSVHVKHGVATLDFSAEFAALANQGESSESAAQKALRQTLARFPRVERMCVTVDGKPFDSQATDWTTPFPVRDAEVGGHTIRYDRVERGGGGGQ